MKERPRGRRGAEHNPTLRTGEYPDSKAITTAFMMFAGSFIMLAKYFINHDRKAPTNISADLSRHPVKTTFPSVTGNRRKR